MEENHKTTNDQDNDVILYMDELRSPLDLHPPCIDADIVDNKVSPSIVPESSPLTTLQKVRTLRIQGTDEANNTHDTELDEFELDDKGNNHHHHHRDHYLGIDDGLIEISDDERNMATPHRPLEGSFPPNFSGNSNSLPDLNVYQQKKTIAQGMMDLALISANANQFRYVLQNRAAHPYYYPSLAMIGMSLFLQVVVGIGLIWNSRYNVKDDNEMYLANRANNWTVIAIFLVTILNVFISSFGVVEDAMEKS